jgi:membrane protein YqaA with SNARE-associated domain
MTDASSTNLPNSAESRASRPDGIAVRWWLAGYFAAVAAGLALLAGPILAPPDAWAAWTGRPVETFAAMAPAAKLLGLGIYLSLCSTFLPLPTGWIVAAVAAREVAVYPDLWATTLTVALVAAAASTVANLNEYHVLTWMMRSRRINRIRDTRGYRAALRWFERSPLTALLVFNILPIPVDVVRWLAAVSRYPRPTFVAAGALLGVGAALALARAGWTGVQRLSSSEPTPRD